MAIQPWSYTVYIQIKWSSSHFKKALWNYLSFSLCIDNLILACLIIIIKKCIKVFELKYIWRKAFTFFNVHQTSTTMVVVITIFIASVYQSIRLPCELHSPFINPVKLDTSLGPVRHVPELANNHGSIERDTQFLRYYQMSPVQTNLPLTTFYQVLHWHVAQSCSPPHHFSILNKSSPEVRSFHPRNLCTTCTERRHTYLIYLLPDNVISIIT